MKETLKKIQNMNLKKLEFHLILYILLAVIPAFTLNQLMYTNAIETYPGNILGGITALMTFIFIALFVKQVHEIKIRDEMEALYKNERWAIKWEIEDEVVLRLKHLFLDPLAYKYKVVDRSFVTDETKDMRTQEDLMNVYKSQYDPDGSRFYQYIKLDQKPKPVHYCNVCRLTYAEILSIARFEKLYPNLTVYHVIADKIVTTPIDIKRCISLDQYEIVKKKFVTKIYAFLCYQNNVSRKENDALEWDEFHADLDKGYASAFIFEYGAMEKGEFCKLDVVSNRYGLSMRNCNDPSLPVDDKDNYCNQMIVAQKNGALYRYVVPGAYFRLLTEEEAGAYREYLKTKVYRTLDEVKDVYKTYEKEIGYKFDKNDWHNEIHKTPNEVSLICDIHYLDKAKWDVRCEYIPKLKYTMIEKKNTIETKLEKSCEIGFDEADYDQL